MKPLDKQALQSFDPDKNLYLSLDLKDPFSPCLQVRDCKVLSIPFLGRILRWLGYTSKPFEKVISYLLSEQAGLHQEKDAELKGKIKQKMDHYFFDKTTQKPKHQKLWNKVKAAYEKCFNSPQSFQPSPRQTLLIPSEQVKEKTNDTSGLVENTSQFPVRLSSTLPKEEKKDLEEKFNQSTDWTSPPNFDNMRTAHIPDSLQQILPKANYYIEYTATIRLEFNHVRLKAFIDESQRKNHYPCVIMLARYGDNAESMKLPSVDIDGKTYPILQLRFSMLPSYRYCDDEFNRKQVLALRAALGLQNK